MKKLDPNLRKKDVRKGKKRCLTMRRKNLIKVLASKSGEKDRKNKEGKKDSQEKKERIKILTRSKSMVKKVRSQIAKMKRQAPTDLRTSKSPQVLASQLSLSPKRLLMLKWNQLN
jgi:hypothetical protein